MYTSLYIYINIDTIYVYAGVDIPDVHIAHVQIRILSDIYIYISHDARGRLCHDSHEAHTCLSYKHTQHVSHYN